MLVTDVVGFFYQELRKSLVDLEGPIIMVENLGSFKARRKKVSELFKSQQNQIDRLDPGNFTQMKIMKSLESQLEKTERLKALMDEEAQRKREFMKNKKDEQTRKNLGE